MTPDSPVSAAAGRPKKAPAPRARHVPNGEHAYKTIAAVAEELNVATHVLRFWESKFPTIKPLKQRGGRRFYSPADVTLLRYVRHLLYEQGLTIRGVQAHLAQQSPRQIQQQAAMTPAAVLKELADIRDLLRGPGGVA